ncbi:MAG: ankyrin repeat domain-containing protein [Luteolibacter sp.]
MSCLHYRVLALGCLVGITCGLLPSCKSPREKGLDELSKRGVEPSGRSLIDAVSRGEGQTACWLLDAGVLTETCDVDGKTALRIAVEKKRVDLVDLLLTHRADPNAFTADRMSVLSSAAETGAGGIFEKLLQAGAKTEGRMKNGELLLPWSIREGRLACARALIEKGADPHTRDLEGHSSLYLALKFGRRDLVESLLDKGANPGEASPQNALFLAIHQGWYDMLPRLSRQGADPNVRCFNGKTPLEHAVDTGNQPLLHALLKSGADVHFSPSDKSQGTAFQRIMERGDASMLDELGNSSVDLSKVDWESLLWTAFRRDNPAMARLTLKNGATGRIRDPQGRLMLEAAAQASREDFVKLLMDYGCPQGRALWLAIRQGDRPMARFLIDCGVSVEGEIVPPWMDSPLTMAIRSGQDGIAVDLLELGASTDRTPDGQSLFHLAIASGCPKTVEELLERGADPNEPIEVPASDSLLRAVKRGEVRWALRNDSNVTPLMLAAHAGNLDTARCLLRAGAKLNVRTRKANLWPITIAAARHDVPMSRLLLGKDPTREQRSIVIRLSEQKARMYDANGAEIFVTSVSTGRKGFSTPTGEFVITNKNREWTSTLYHASMPFFQRLSCKDFGLHQGVVPGYPASHGCIRVPAGNAAKLFAMTDTGDRVRIEP